MTATRRSSVEEKSSCDPPSSHSEGQKRRGLEADVARPTHLLSDFPSALW